MTQQRRWNANINYHPLLLDRIPQGARRILDVGCGDGVLCAQLVEAGVPQVIGLDADVGVLARARSHYSELRIEWMHGDVFQVPFAAGEFDAVLSVATLHHIDAAKGLTRFAELVRPGGVVGIVGLAANDWWDLPRAAIGLSSRTALGLVRGHWVHSAPIAWPPPETYRQMKRIAAEALPGSWYRRHLLGRYSLIWEKPESAPRSK
jgi:SAM-dependent methyltransferase